MTNVTEVYEELRYNNMALEAVADMLAAVDESAMIRPDRMFYLLRLIIEHKECQLEKLAAC